MARGCAVVESPHRRRGLARNPATNDPGFVFQKRTRTLSAVGLGAVLSLAGTDVHALNQMIDVHGKRVYVEYFVRIPDMVLLTLAVLSVLTHLLAGYLLGLRQRRWGIPTALMIFTYATVFSIVTDLDRPARGLFFVHPEPMLELRDTVRESVAAD